MQSQSDGSTPRLAVPARPTRPLSPLAFLKKAGSDTIGMFDEELFDELIVQRRYGPVPVAFVSDPAAIRHILVDRFDDYPRLPAVRRLYAAEIGTGTLATTGPIWWRHRRIAVPTLDRRALAPELPGLMAAADEEATALHAIAGPGHFNLETQIARIWITLLNRMVTGGDPRGLPILAWLARVPRKARPLDLLPMPARLRNLVSSVAQTPERATRRAELRAMIGERIAGGYGGRRDLLWRIAHGVDRETGQPLPPDEMADEASSLVAAGDTTIRALTWVWYLLALHPEVEERLHEELDTVLGAGPMNPDHLRTLPYLRRVIDETMRLYPPVPLILRQARVADTVCGRKVRRGTVVILAPWIVHRHRRLWDDPDRFDPDRFTDERSAGRPGFAYVPFSVGPGVCSGSQFALAQMVTIIGSIARRYRFRLLPNHPVVPFGGISLHPRGGLWGSLERR